MTSIEAQARYLLARSIPAMLEAPFLARYAKANKDLKRVLDAIDDGILTPEDMHTAHEVVAKQAAREMLGEYLRMRAKSKVRHKYRQGANRLSGQLEAALRTSDITAASPDRIHLLNLDTMNTEAAHWGRINYGVAGPKKSPRRSRQFPFRFDGKVLPIRVGTTAGPRANFRVPEFSGGSPRVGYFTPQGELHIGKKHLSDDANHDRLYELGYRRVGGRFSGGVKPYHFVDAGAAVVAEDLGEAYKSAIRRSERRVKREANRRTRY